jgi:hypothetical protein
VLEAGLYGVADTWHFDLIGLAIDSTFQTPRHGFWEAEALGRSRMSDYIRGILACHALLRFRVVHVHV